MIPDLQFPDDAEKTISGIQAGLRYDCALAVMGKSCEKLTVPEGQPDFSTPFRCGGRDEDLAVRKESPGLLSRFALISMITRLDVGLQNLLLQRHVIEEVTKSGRKIDGLIFWALLKKVDKESRRGPVAVCSELVVTKPSSELVSRMKWFGGLVDIRNCLSHRMGQVQMHDVKPHGVPLEQTTDTDRLRAVWLRPKILVDGKEVELPYKNIGEAKRLDVAFEEYEREWKVGDIVHVTPEDCQAIGISLSFLANQILFDFEREMKVILGINSSPSTPLA